jgi:DNA-binding NarL/FixJ family response regulator
MSTGRAIRVLVIDDHRILRDALRTLLEREDGIELAGETGDAIDGIGLAARTRPDVIVLDIGMEGINGIQAAYRLRKEAPASRVLMLSQYDDEEYVLEAFGKAGAAGYLLKSDAGVELLSAIRAVAAGKRYISPAVAPIVLEKLRHNGARDGAGQAALTKREREILRLVAQGASSKEIARTLGISPKTVQVHRGNLAAKLHLTSTAALVRYAIKHKLMKLD